MAAPGSGTSPRVRQRGASGESAEEAVWAAVILPVPLLPGLSHSRPGGGPAPGQPSPWSVRVHLWPPRTAGLVQSHVPPVRPWRGPGGAGRPHTCAQPGWLGGDLSPPVSAGVPAGSRSGQRHGNLQGRPQAWRWRLLSPARGPGSSPAGGRGPGGLRSGTPRPTEAHRAGATHGAQPQPCVAHLCILPGSTPVPGVTRA